MIAIEPASKNRALQVSGVAGTLAILLGLVVLVGWHSRLTALVQIHPALVPMQYNTALGFLMGGAALLARLARRAAFGCLAAAMTVLLGAMTLLQYVTGVDLRIDQLLMRSYIFVETSHPGRMAPNTALCFALTGLGLLALMRTRGGQAQPATWPAAILGSAILGLGSVALFGYLGDLEAAYGWGELTRMAVHSAAGFLLLGLAIVSAAWGLEPAPCSFGPRWLPLPAGLAALTVTLCLWQAVSHHEAQQVAAIQRVNGLALTHGLEYRIQSHTLALQRMAARMGRQDGLRFWTEDARMHVRDLQLTGLLHLRPDGTVVDDTDGALAWGAAIPGRPELDTALQAAAHGKEAVITGSWTIDGREAVFGIVVPMAASGGDRGFLLGIVSLPALIDETRTAYGLPDYDVTLHEAGRQIFPLRDHDHGHGFAEVAVAGTPWDARYRASPRWHAAQHTALPATLLVVGGLLSLMLAATIGSMQHGMVRAQDAEAANRRLLREFDERQRAEQQVRQLNLELERRVAERTRESEQRAEELERSNADLEQFAYVTSHDLQEPLRAIRGFGGLLQRRLGSECDPQVQEYLEQMVDGAHRMRTMIQALLSYSRVSRKRDPLAPVPAVSAVEEACANLRAALEESGARVEVGPLPRVRADAMHLTLLFQNLIGNAVKYRGEQQPLVSISARPADGYHEFSVRDNGIGIDPRFATRVFEIFQRLHTREEYPGTGIGLAICKRIVQRHAGRIWCEPGAGPGTEIRFTLQAVADDPTLSDSRTIELSKEVAHHVT